MNFWLCKNKKIPYGGRTLIMGIVNVTPDSFSDGGDYFTVDAAVAHAKQLAADGADLLDLGAQSTRPGSTPVTAAEELRRLLPVLREVRAAVDVPLSVDTFYPEVAEKCLEIGADIINDVSGVVSPAMAKCVKMSRCGWILMHSGNGGVAEVKAFFAQALAECDALGVDRAQLCLDMGIGFGKTREQDFALLANVKQYKPSGVPLLLGTSRKRVIGEGSGQPEPKERIYGNIAADTAAILGGVDIIRLHDVKHERQGIAMADRLLRMNNEK